MRLIEFPLFLCVLLGAHVPGLRAGDLPAAVRTFIENRCTDCHDADTKKGNLDLSAHNTDFANAESFARWVKIYDRVESGEGMVVVDLDLETVTEARRINPYERDRVDDGADRVVLTLG